MTGWVKGLTTPAEPEADDGSRNPVAVRLAAVKLAYRFDKTPDQVIEIAAPLAEWILNGTAGQGRKAPRGTGRP